MNGNGSLDQSPKIDLGTAWGNVKGALDQVQTTRQIWKVLELSIRVIEQVIQKELKSASTHSDKPNE